jgi:hypothetical protein
MTEAPAHLRAWTQHWYASVLEDYELEEHHRRLLQLAAEAFDRAQEAREAIKRDGAYLEGRYGLRAHPAVSVERDSRLAFARLLRDRFI